ncbi:MAG TPA: hypothetical protein V6D10_17725 [Trichocoleus sp.]
MKKYGSLQARERQYLLNVRRKLFDRTTALLDLARKIATELSISEQEAWEVLQTGAATADPETKSKLLPYLTELTEKLNPQYAALQYPREAVVLLFMSRLDTLKEIAADLEESFDISLDKKSVEKFDRIPTSERLQAKEREILSRQIVEQLPEDIFDALLEFVAGEERQWKDAESEVAEEVNPNDPLPFAA